MLAKDARKFYVMTEEFGTGYPVFVPPVKKPMQNMLLTFGTYSGYYRKQLALAGVDDFRNLPLRGEVYVVGDRYHVIEDYFNKHLKDSITFMDGYDGSPRYRQRRLLQGKTAALPQRER